MASKIDKQMEQAIRTAIWDLRDRIDASARIARTIRDAGATDLNEMAKRYEAEASELRWAECKFLEAIGWTLETDSEHEDRMARKEQMLDEALEQAVES